MLIVPDKLSSLAISTKNLTFPDSAISTLENANTADAPDSVLFHSNSSPATIILRASTHVLLAVTVNHTLLIGSATVIEPSATNTSVAD
jgi:hypothetical protein